MPQQYKKEMELAYPYGPLGEADTPERSVPLTREQRLRMQGMVHRHYDVVWRHLERQGIPPADAEDCLQYALEAALNQLSKIEEDNELDFLLNRARDKARWDRRKIVRQEGLRKVNLSDPPPSRQPTERVELQELLRKVLGEMSPKLRQVFEFCEIEQMTAPDVARMLRIPEGTVRSRLRLAVEQFEQLAAKFSDEGSSDDAQ